MSVTPTADLSKLRINRDDPPPAVKRALGRVLWLVAGAVLIVAVVVIIGRRGTAVPVQVVTVAATAGGSGAVGGGSTGTVAVVANGYVVARTKAAVSAKIPGRLAALNVSEGSRVEKGEVIARLDNADYAAAVGQAEAQVASAKATLIETQSDRDQLQREFVRVRDIHSQNPNLVSTQEVENAESKARQGDARVEAQQARVDAAAAALRVAQANLENTYIRAPFSGTVLRKEAEVGEVVAPSVGGGLTRGAVVTMADLATLEVEVDVNEAYIARITSGQQARITLDAYPDTAFRGVVRQVVPTADRQRATVQVKVSIVDRDPRILTEMGAKVEFLQTSRAVAASGAAQAVERPRIIVPAEAVRSENGRDVVWIVRDGRLQSRDVDAGPVSGNFREIRSGLSGGEQLLVGGVETPKEGQRVKVGP
ncbi:MAG TPA: efflux RND transporter periplasmic adaptor subunit [Gemmatimonadales bacterium]|nr:efflux RND transporter periplasmic adaptor subunit [Gemmatimonadales bacterium]